MAFAHLSVCSNKGSFALDSLMVNSLWFHMFYKNLYYFHEETDSAAQQTIGYLKKEKMIMITWTNCAYFIVPLVLSNLLILYDISLCSWISSWVTDLSSVYPLSLTVIAFLTLLMSKRIIYQCIVLQLQLYIMRTSFYLHIQLRKMNIIPLVNKPYVNEITLNEQNMYQKSC